MVSSKSSVPGKRRATNMDRYDPAVEAKRPQRLASPARPRRRSLSESAIGTSLLPRKTVSKTGCASPRMRGMGPNAPAEVEVLFGAVATNANHLLQVATRKQLQQITTRKLQTAYRKRKLHKRQGEHKKARQTVWKAAKVALTSACVAAGLAY